jgi:HAD superfamily hydrolase (TIGR01549 family)
MPRAVLFDIDGTLIDSLDLHVQAWREAFARFGKDVSAPTIRSQIGKSGEQILPELLTDEEIERFGEDLEEHRLDVFQRRYLPWARPFPGARELLARLKQSGESVGLASSCRRTELGQYLRMLGGASLVDAATTADDTMGSRPTPGVFAACLEKLGLDPGEAVAVGDSPYDAMEATRAGLLTVGVLSGGFAERELEAAGCTAVYQDVGELLGRLGSTPLAARAPG